MIWSPGYTHNSAGPKALHRLCHELNLAGCQAFIWSDATNPEWHTPIWQGPIGDAIAVYPEVVSGNPLHAERVVRWVLNTPGKLGGDRSYDPAEVVYSWAQIFYDAPILNLPTIELDIYFDRHLERSIGTYFTGRGTANRDLPGFVEISWNVLRDRHRLADLLNHAEVMYSFPNVTGLIDIAGLCGCPVIIVPSGEFTKEQLDAQMDWTGIGWDEMPPPFDSQILRDRQCALLEEFHRALPEFIERTQGRSNLSVPDWSRLIPAADRARKNYSGA